MENASIPGYVYGTSAVPASPITVRDLQELEISVGFTAADEHYLRIAGEVLRDQAKQLVDHWRGQIIAKIPHLVKHSQTPEGQPIPEYGAASGARFVQWVLDTCLRPYDQDWLNYQQEIALRHTSVKKNQTDSVNSTPYVPLRHIIAFIPVMNETIKPYLSAKGHSAEDVEKMHLAWCKSMQLQMSIWTGAYSSNTPNEW